LTHPYLVLFCIICYGIDRRETSNPCKLLGRLQLRFLSRSRCRRLRTVIRRITANKKRLPFPPVILAEDRVSVLIFRGRVGAKLLFPALDFGDAFFQRDVVGPLLGSLDLRLPLLLRLFFPSLFFLLFLQTALDERRLGWGSRFILRDLQLHYTALQV